MRDELTTAKEGFEGMSVDSADALLRDPFRVDEIPRPMTGKDQPASLRPTEQLMELWCSPRMREVKAFIR